MIRFTEALLRAQGHGWQATEGPHSAFFIPSAHEPFITRVLRFSTGMDGVLWAHCSCPGGFWRDEHAPVTCWHAAAVLSLLHSQRRVVLADGLMIWRRP